MLSYNDLRPGVYFVFEGQPFEVLESNQLKMQQRRPVLQTRIRSLITGKIIEHNFQQSDTLPEADVRKKDLMYLYGHRQKFWFCEPDKPGGRFELAVDVIGDQSRFLKNNTVVEGLFFEDKIISLKLPIKIDLKVTQAPPGTKGNTAQGGTKSVTLESGAVINVPLFINEGDTVRINTQTGEYVERISK